MGNHFGKLNAHFVNAKSEEEVKNYVRENLKDRKYQQVIVNEHELSKIQHMFTSQPARVTHTIIEVT